MLVNLKVEKFRGINNLTIDEFKQINLMVGKNNSGKTSVLEAIFLNLGGINPELTARINSFRQYSKTDDATFRSFFHNFNIQEAINVEIKSKNPKQFRKLEIIPKTSLNAKDNILNLNDIPDNGNTSFANQIQGLENKFKFKKSSKENFKKYTSHIVRKNQGLEIKQVNNYQEELRGVFLTPRNFTINNASRLSKIKFQKKVDKIIKILRNIEPKLVNIEILENNEIYADIGIENLIPIKLLGDGINRILAIILAVFENENGIVLIDEIENGLHYESLVTLWEAIFEITKDTETQIFATTHSWENIQTMTHLLDNKEHDNLLLYRIENENGEIDAVKYNQEMLIQTVDKEWELR